MPAGEIKYSKHFKANAVSFDVSLYLTTHKFLSYQDFYVYEHWKYEEGNTEVFVVSYQCYSVREINFLVYITMSIVSLFNATVSLVEGIHMH